MRFPPPLRPGARVHVIAPSSPFDRRLVLRGMAWLSERYRVTYRSDLFASAGFLAGSDQRRLEELSDAMLDPTIAAVVTARGGHGVLRVVSAAPWGALLDRPKWIVGFSDPTILHLEVTRLGLASLHAANVAGLGRGDSRARLEWLTALEQPQMQRSYRGESWSKGCVRGALVGGNLTMLTMAAACGRLSLPDGCILAIEDVTESSYRIDRMLTVLKVGGYLDRVAGYVIGHFTDCPSGPFRVPVESVLRAQLPLNRPTLASVEFGHDFPNRPLTLGARAILDADQGLLVTPSGESD